jgi:hypothetical protein
MNSLIFSCNICRTFSLESYPVPISCRGITTNKLFRQMKHSWASSQVKWLNCKWTSISRTTSKHWFTLFYQMTQLLAWESFTCHCECFRSYVSSSWLSSVLQQVTGILTWNCDEQLLPFFPNDDYSDSQTELNQCSGRHFIQRLTWLTGSKHSPKKILWIS